MFESIVANITNTIPNVARTMGIPTRKTPWLVPVAIMALFLVL